MFFHSTNNNPLPRMYLIKFMFYAIKRWAFSYCVRIVLLIIMNKKHLRMKKRIMKAAMLLFMLAGATDRKSTRLNSSHLA